MEIHYEHTREHTLGAAPKPARTSPAWMTLELMGALRDWLGAPVSRPLARESARLQFAYEVQSVPVLEFAQDLGALIHQIHRQWPIQILGMAEGGQLVELSFPVQDGAFLVRQRNMSGAWCENLDDFYVTLTLPDPRQAQDLSRLLQAEEEGAYAAALEWESADFVQQQGLAELDRTHSFCYVGLRGGGPQEDPAACLAGLTMEQKEALWRLFLEKHLTPPEFEWLRNALLEGDVPQWIQWHVALYRTLEGLGIRFLCRNGQFELMDRDGGRLYFGVDHTNAAEQVLMKILFPLNE